MSRGVPMRSCVVCRTRAPKGSLLRFVRREHAAVADHAQREPGRGAYVCAEERCRHAAISRLGRALRAPNIQSVVTEGS